MTGERDSVSRNFIKELGKKIGMELEKDNGEMEKLREKLPMLDKYHNGQVSANELLHILMELKISGVSKSDLEKFIRF